jgi:hypothetical protein
MGGAGKTRIGDGIKFIKPKVIVQGKILLRSWKFYISLLGIIYFLVPLYAANQPITPEEWVDRFQEWLQTNNIDESFDKLPNKLSSIAEVLDARSKTENQIADLEKQVQTSEGLLEEKKKVLHGLQQKIDVLKLTPNQIATLERYNKSLNRDPDFSDWMTEKTTWFEIGKDIILSLVFLFLGIWFESIRKKRKKKV